MSYILDALKKAEAERNLGEVPDLHAQPYIQPLMGQPAHRWRKASLWAVPAFLIAAAALIALAIVKPWSASPVIQLAQKAASTPTSPAPTVATAAAVAAPSAAPPSVSPSHTAAKAEAPKPARPAPKKAPQPDAKPVPQISSPATPPSATQPNGDATTLPTLRELPDNVQQEIPKFTTNGYLYSANKADRTVLINNKLLHEGDSVAPDLTVEKLTPNGMVLNYKGYRYRASY